MKIYSNLRIDIALTTMIYFLFLILAPFTVSLSPNTGIWVVQSGETCNNAFKALGLRNCALIQQLNSFDLDTLFPGDKVTVPYVKEVVPPARWQKIDGTPHLYLTISPDTRSAIYASDTASLIAGTRFYSDILSRSKGSQRPVRTVTPVSLITSIPTAVTHVDTSIAYPTPTFGLVSSNALSTASSTALTPVSSTPVAACNPRSYTPTGSQFRAAAKSFCIESAFYKDAEKIHSITFYGDDSLWGYTISSKLAASCSDNKSLLDYLNSSCEDTIVNIWKNCKL